MVGSAIGLRLYLYTGYGSRVLACITGKGRLSACRKSSIPRTTYPWLPKGNVFDNTVLSILTYDSLCQALRNHIWLRTLVMHA